MAPFVNYIYLVYNSVSASYVSYLDDWTENGAEV